MLPGQLAVEQGRCGAMRPGPPGCLKGVWGYGLEIWSLWLGAQDLGLKFEVYRIRGLGFGAQLHLSLGFKISG